MAGLETIRIFRAIDAPLRAKVGGDPYVPGSPEEASGAAQLMEAGVGDGSLIKVLYSAPGFSLVYVWFKAHYPLIRHSHSNDCLYYIISGGIRLGTERLGPGDGFFVPGNAPYTYTVGDEGVELVEFRHSSTFGTKSAGATKAFFDRAVKAVQENRANWRATPAPLPARRGASRATS